MPTSKRNHDECLAAFCILCVGRADPKLKLTEELIQLIKTYVPNLNYDRDHKFLANGICGTCKTRLYSQTKLIKRKLPEIRYDY